MKCRFVKYLFLLELASCSVVPITLSSCSYHPPKMLIAGDGGKLIPNNDYIYFLKWYGIYDSSIRLDKFHILFYGWDSENNTHTEQIDDPGYFDMDYSSYNDLSVMRESKKFIFKSEADVPDGAFDDFCFQINYISNSDIIGQSDFIHMSSQDLISCKIISTSNPQDYCNTQLDNGEYNGWNILTQSNGYIYDGADANIKNTIFSHWKSDFTEEAINFISIATFSLKNDFWNVYSIKDDWEFYISFIYDTTTTKITQLEIKLQINLKSNMAPLVQDASYKINIKSYGSYKLIGAFTNKYIDKNENYSEFVLDKNYLSIAPIATKDEGCELPTHISYEYDAINGGNILPNLNFSKFTSPSVFLGNLKDNGVGIYIKSFWLEHVTNITPIEIKSWNTNDDAATDIPKVIQRNDFEESHLNDYSDFLFWNTHLGWYFDHTNLFQAYFDNKYFVRSSNPTLDDEYSVSAGPVASEVTQNIPFYQVVSEIGFRTQINNRIITDWNSMPDNPKTYFLFILNPVYNIVGEPWQLPSWYDSNKTYGPDPIHFAFNPNIEIPTTLL